MSPAFFSRVKSPPPTIFNFQQLIKFEKNIFSKMCENGLSMILSNIFIYSMYTGAVFLKDQFLLKF